MKTLAITLALTAAATSAMAQSRSSFLTTQAISGITITNVGTNSYKVDVANLPTFTLNSVIYNITSVIGFWAMNDTTDVTGSTSNFGVWQAQASNAGSGGIVGWKTNPNTGITPGGSQTFTFNSLGAFDRFGLHVATSTNFPGTTGLTGYITTPTPGATALLGLGGLVMTRRRR